MILNFLAKSADLYIGVRVPFPCPVGLTFRVQLILAEIELATKDDFNDLDGRITILPEVEGAEDTRDGIGMMNFVEAVKTDYHNSPASWIADARIPKSQFDELLASVRAGQIPSNISIYVDGREVGLEFGWDPDGSEKKWDNRTYPKLKVAAVSFQIPLYQSTIINGDMP